MNVHPHSREGLYDEIERLQDGITKLIKRFQEVAADRDEWKQQHENLLEVHRRDLAALAEKLRAAQGYVGCMSEERAREVLSDFIQPDGTLYHGGQYLAWSPAEPNATLDAQFTADELEAIAWWMKNKPAAQQCESEISKGSER